MLVAEPKHAKGSAEHTAWQTSAEAMPETLLGQGRSRQSLFFLYTVAAKNLFDNGLSKQTQLLPNGEEVAVREKCYT